MGIALVGGISSAQATPESEDAEAVANAIESFTDRLAQASDALGEYQDLAENLPLTDLAPGEPGGLNLNNLLDDAVGALGTYASMGDLATALEARDGTYGGITVQFGAGAFSQPAVTTTATSITIPIHAARVVNQPLDFTFGPVDMQGGSLGIDFRLDTTLTFDVDPALVSDGATAPANAVSLRTAPTPPAIDVCAHATGSVGIFTARFGFTDVKVSTDNPATGGTPEAATLHACAKVGFTDPDSTGGITRDEWASHALTELATADIVDGDPGDDLSAKFYVDASLIGGDAFTAATAADASIAFTDLNLAAGPAPTVTPVFGSLLDFTSITPGDVANGLSQFLAAFGGSQTAGNGAIPFVKDGFSRAFEVVKPLKDYARRLTDADVVCGTDPGTATNMPTGSTANLADDTFVYCRARTAYTLTAGLTTWTSPNATEIEKTSAAAADPTIGAAPEENAKFQMDGAGSFAVSVAFTADPDAGGAQPAQAFTAVPRPQTAQQLFEELAVAAGLDLGTSGLTYDAATKSLAYRLKGSFNPAAVGPGVENAPTWDFGDQLRNVTHLGGPAGLRVGNDDAGCRPGQLGRDLRRHPHRRRGRHHTVGRGPEPARSLLRQGEDRSRRARDQPRRSRGHRRRGARRPGRLPRRARERRRRRQHLCAGNGLRHRQGRHLEARRHGRHQPRPRRPARRRPGPGTSLQTIAGAISVGELAFNLDDAHLDAVCNLKATAGLHISADVAGGAQTLAEAGVALNWPQVFETDSCTPDPSGLEITPSASFNTDLFHFDPFPSVSGKATAVAANPNEGVVLIDGTKNPTAGDGNDPSEFPALGNFTNLTLRNKTTGATCIILTISAQEISCATSLSGGTRQGDLPNNNKWKTGDEYEVEGNALGMLSIILDNLDALVDQLEAMGADVDATIPLINMSTKDLVAKIQSIKRTIDDLRGFPKAQVQCDLDNNFSTHEDVSILDDGATVYCRATTQNTPTAVQWKVTTKDPAGSAAIVTNGESGLDPAIADVPGALTTVGPTPSTSVQFTVNDGDPITDRTTLDEWQLSLEWSDDGGANTAEFPAAVASEHAPVARGADRGQARHRRSERLRARPARPADAGRRGAHFTGTADSSSTGSTLHDTDALSRRHHRPHRHPHDEPRKGDQLLDHLGLRRRRGHVQNVAGGWADGQGYQIVGNGTKDLVIKLGAGFCGEAGGLTCDNTFRKTDPLSVPLNLSVGALGDLVSVDSANQLDLGYKAKATLEVGIPLKLGIPVPTIVDTTGLELEGRAAVDPINLSAGVGPIKVNLGAAIADKDPAAGDPVPGVGKAKVGAQFTFKRGDDDGIPGTGPTTSPAATASSRAAAGSLRPSRASIRTAVARRRPAPRTTRASLPTSVSRRRRRSSATSSSPATSSRCPPRPRAPRRAARRSQP